MSSARAIVVALAAVTLVATEWASTAAAASHVRRTCARQTRVMSTPGGLVVGFLARGTPVVLVRRSHNGVWADVLAVRSIGGWIHMRDLC